MRRITVITIAVGVIFVFPLTSNAAAKKYKNCTELNKVYPGGVALPGAVNVGGVTKKEPKYDKALYTANKKSDRDGDGIACER